MENLTFQGRLFEVIQASSKLAVCRWHKGCFAWAQSYVRRHFINIRSGPNGEQQTGRRQYPGHGI